MTKIFQFLALLLLLVLTNSQVKDKGTESYFISPHGLGRTPQVSMALEKIPGMVKVKRTTYNISSITYIIDNVTIGVTYNPSKQSIDIPVAELVKVSGGIFEFSYQFNYTKIQNRNNITGYAYGSVLSGSFNYSKEVGYCGSFLCWRLPQTKGIEDLTIANRLRLKRMEPYNETDLANIEDMLDTATTSIDPSNAKQQFLPIFNQIFRMPLNESLNHEIFGENINYTYTSKSHGEMKMNIVHQVYGFGLKPQEGFRVIFNTLIDGWPEPVCNNTVVPYVPNPFQSSGGSQTFHLNCLYESVVFYLQSNGWLDTVLNKEWEVDAFQFFAGDLFDIINNLYLTFSPRAILDGQCKAQKDNLKFTSREKVNNDFGLLATYNCSLKGTNSAGSIAQIMKFTVNTRIYIQVAATKKTLTFKVHTAGIDNFSVELGNYTVNNVGLAKYRAEKVLQKMVNTLTFGTDFPTLIRESPKTRVEANQVFYYDSSHFSTASLLDE